MLGLQRLNGAPASKSLDEASKRRRSSRPHCLSSPTSPVGGFGGKDEAKLSITACMRKRRKCFRHVCHFYLSTDESCTTVCGCFCHPETCAQELASPSQRKVLLRWRISRTFRRSFWRCWPSGQRSPHPSPR